MRKHSKDYYYDKLYEYEYFSEDFYGEKYSNENDWLESLSPQILEAYDEYITDKNDKEDY